MRDDVGREARAHVAVREGRSPKYPPGVIVTISRGQIDNTTAIMRESIATPWGSKGCLRQSGVEIAHSRNQIVRSVDELVPNWEWLLFIDSDHKLREYHYNTVMARLLDWDVPVVSGTVCRRSAPFRLNAFSSFDPPEDLKLADLDPDGLVKVAAVGMGFCLIRREAFNAVGDPWFRVGQENPELGAEDLDFTWRCTQRGQGVYVDQGLAIGHNLGPGVTVWPGAIDRRPFIELEGEETFMIPVFPRSRREQGL